MRQRFVICLASLASLAGMPPPSWAGPFASMVVFGDSLSDTGNVFAATGHAFPPAP